VPGVWILRVDGYRRRAVHRPVVSELASAGGFQLDGSRIHPCIDHGIHPSRQHEALCHLSQLQEKVGTNLKQPYIEIFAMS